MTILWLTGRPGTWGSLVPRPWRGLLGCLFMGVLARPVLAIDLQDVQFAALPGNRVEIHLDFSGPVSPPQSFATESPSRIALDFEGVSSKLDRKAVPIGVGAVHSLVAVEASNKPYATTGSAERIRGMAAIRGVDRA